MLPTAPRRTGIVFFPAFDWAIEPNHPERQERLLYTRDQIWEEGLLDIEGIEEFAPSMAEVEDVARVHIGVPSVEHHLTTPHRISAGGAITAGLETVDHEVESAFALVRPPGHHARRVVHGLRGFCVINIEAVMIEHLRRHRGDRRVAIIDTDCHHGDGTQDVYWHDPDTLFISIHQDGRTLYPGSGFPDEFGGPNAYGATLNVPLPPGTTDEGLLQVIDQLVLPVLEDWKPDLIVNSAGQDNHFSDPITDMAITAQGYAEMTRRLRPHVAVLEGGYSVQGALPYVNTGILLAMAGLDTSAVVEPDRRGARLAPAEGTAGYIERLCGLLLQKYMHRDALGRRKFADETHVEEDRLVPYDGAGFTEHQSERVRICRDCGGAVRLETWVDPADRTLAVEIPRRACPACRAEAEQTWSEADADRYTRMELRDRPHDRIERRQRT